MNPFPHARQSNPAVRLIVTKMVQNLRRDTSAVVPDSKDNFVVERPQGNVRPGTLGMAVNISQALLQDAKQRKLKRVGQAAEVLWYVQAGGNAAAFGEAFYIPARG